MNLKKFLNLSKQTKSKGTVITKTKPSQSIPKQFKSNSTIRCLEPPCKLTNLSPVCMYYYSKHDEKEYIILTPSSEDTNKCYKYDILQNKWIHFTTYPNTIKAVCHSAAIDQVKDLLYISHGHASIFAIFDLKNNVWTVKSVRNCNGGVVANAASVVLPNSEFHVFAQPDASTINIHLRYEPHKKQFVKASQNGIDNNCYLESDTLLFVNKHNILMVFGGYNDDGFTDKIWYAPYTDYHQKTFEWNEFAIHLPFQSSPQCTVVFGAVIIIWYKIHHNSAPAMAILDCDVSTQDAYKWISPILDQKLIIDNVTSIVATRSNYLHFINPYKQLHYKVHLSKFIPQNIYTKYVEDETNNNDDDAKCSTCVQLKDKLQMIQRLVDDLLNNENEVKQRYELQINDLIANNNQLMEECKETKLELNEVKKELNKLKRLKYIDLKNYLNWSGDDIVDWILSLEQGKYEQYENKLRVKFKEESVDGNAIQYINTLELKGWGVGHFMHRANLYKHFQQLVNQNKGEGQVDDDISTPYIG